VDEMSDRVAVDDRTSRVPPLARPWSDDDAAGIGAWGHPAATYPPLLLTRTLQRHPQLAARTRHLGEGLYIDGRLSHRDRTIAILRTCAQVRCAYEWGGQAAFWGPIAKVSGEECDALAVGAADDARWNDGERAIVGAIDELEATGTWSDTTWASLSDHLDEEQRMELLIVAGWYRTICTLCNALTLGIEDWMRPWPAGAS
jgi:alkylhydroperoxidase family enzyme